MADLVDELDGGCWLLVAVALRAAVRWLVKCLQGSALGELFSDSRPYPVALAFFLTVSSLATWPGSLRLSLVVGCCGRQ
jgi:hypothetical protein